MIKLPQAASGCDEAYRPIGRTKSEEIGYFHDYECHDLIRADWKIVDIHVINRHHKEFCVINANGRAKNSDCYWVSSEELLPEAMLGSWGLSQEKGLTRVPESDADYFIATDHYSVIDSECAIEFVEHLSRNVYLVHASCKDIDGPEPAKRHCQRVRAETWRASHQQIWRVSWNKPTAKGKPKNERASAYCGRPEEGLITTRKSNPRSVVCLD